MRMVSVILVCLSLLSQTAQGAGEVVVTSPNGEVSMTIGVNGQGQLNYELTRQGRMVVEPSALGLTIDGVRLGRGVTLGNPTRQSKDEIYATRGVHSIARNHYNGVAIPVTHDKSGATFVLEARVFDDGAGFRYVAERSGLHQVSGEDTVFQIPADSAIWFQTNVANYEEIHKRLALADVPADTFMGPPVVAELPGGGYAALTEAALFNYSGMTIRAPGDAGKPLEGVFQDDRTWELEGTIKSPWRVIMVSPDLNGLVNCDIIANLNEPPAPELANADWIRPGRGFWHWWSGQMGNWDSVAFDRQFQWVDYAAQFGFECYLVDAGWEHTWAEPGKGKWALLKELTTYADERSVGIVVWKRWKTGRTEGIDMEGLDDPESRREFLRRCKAAGAVGIKIDYMDSESKEMIDFYTGVLKDAAQAHLMVDFHGANKPTGESRTYPHEVTREGIRGLEYNKWSALPPQHYASLPFTRLLAGHADFTPCTFNVDMLKGTTFALQLATAVCYTSPVMFYADKPELYLKSPAVDMIKAIPSVWDETRVLAGSAIGDLAVMARRRGDTWFVGIINGGRQRSYELNLAFLADGPYASVRLADDSERPDNLIRTEATVQASSSLTVDMNAGGGFVAMFKPAR